MNNFIKATLEALPEFLSKYAFHMILWCIVVALAWIGDILRNIRDLMKNK